MWHVAKRIKSLTSLDDYSCDGSGLYNYNDLSYQVDKVEQQLGVDSSDVIYQNMSAEHLKGVGELFVYLNACPQASLSWWLKPLTIFYKNLIKTKSPFEILLTLNRFTKTLRDVNAIRTIEDLFVRATQLFNVDYKNVQNILHVADDAINQNISLESGVESHINAQTESIAKLNIVITYSIFVAL